MRLIDSLSDHVPTEDEKNWAFLAHVAPMVGLFVVPLIVLWLKGKKSKWVRSQAIESLNFVITLAIGYAIGFVTMMVAVGVFILIAMFAIGVVLHLAAGVKVLQGGTYRYPIAIRLIKD